MRRRRFSHSRTVHPALGGRPAGCRTRPGGIGARAGGRRRPCLHVPTPDVQVLDGGDGVGGVWGVHLGGCSPPPPHNRRLPSLRRASAPSSPPSATASTRGWIWDSAPRAPDSAPPFENPPAFLDEYWGG
jgi:hypothetical protein